MDLPQLIAKASQVFSAAAPINRRDLFAGRIPQLQRVFDAINTRGRHAVIFGERGVGKTSLANIVKDIATSDGSGAVVKINCSKDDDFASTWRKAFGEIPIVKNAGRWTMEFQPSPVEEEETADSLLSKKVTPNDLRRVADKLGKLIVIFDEFDRIRDRQGLFADTIKTLSDASTDCTIVLVGVADDINALIQEHASIDRALVQILMPRMTTTELHEILNKAVDALGMSMDHEARNLIVLLSQGLPHYTHVLGQASAIEAIKDKRLDVTVADVNASIGTAIENTQQSVRTAYQQATASPRKNTLFKQVLLSCALAEVDDLGFFASSDVRDPMTKIMRKRYEIPNFSQHLDKFSSADRGNVLEKTGKQRRFRFRFANPLLQPFVILRGIADGMLKGDLMKLLQKKLRT